MDILEGLNPEQKQAVTHPSGPLLIVAGAGTGKTTVITRRIAWLIMEQGIKPEEILALTFTNKAADEMEERVDKLLPYGYVDLWVSTFHTFCQRILADHALDIGLPRGVELVDETGQWLLVREHWDKFELDYYRPSHNPTKFIRELLKHFSKLKDEEITPGKYLEYAEGLRLGQDDIEASGGKSTRYKIQDTNNTQDTISKDEIDRVVEVANAYHVYQQLLLDNDKMDFGDLINYVLKLFRERPNILKKYQEQFKYILVDEFQDTNWAQYDLVKMLAQYPSEARGAGLAEPRHNLTVVADDDQSIYRFRGASMSNVIQFSREFSAKGALPAFGTGSASGGTKKVSLVRNYRSGQQILDLAYNFIQLNNPNRLEVSVIASGALAERSNPDSASEQVVRNDRVQRVVKIASSSRSSGTPRNDTEEQPLLINKRLIAQTKEVAQIEHLHCQSGHDEARIVAETILELKKQDKTATWNDFAVLVRANNQAQEFEQALTAANIPHRNSSSAGLYKTRLIADILAFFDALVDYHEGRAIFRLLNLPFLDISMEDIIKLTHWADRKRVSLYSLLSQGQAAGVANETSLAEITRLRNGIEAGQAAAKDKRPTQVLHQWLSLEAGYLAYLGALPDADNLEQFRNLRAFWEHLLQIEKGLGDGRVKDVLAVIKQELQSGDEGDLPQDLESGPEMVKLMTGHAAKGLEFKYVFVTNLVDRRFPTTERREAIIIPDALVKEIIPPGDAHLEEERRLFYVAMTRAKQGLFLTSAENYGGATKKKLSRFLQELAQTSPSFKISNAPLAVRVNDFLPRLIGGQAKKASEFKLPIPRKFSFTQLRLYSEDPFAYKLQYIYKVPSLGKDVFSYGSTIHTTLQRFFQLLMERTRSVQTDLFGNEGQYKFVIASVAKQSDSRIGLVDKIASSATPPRNDVPVTLEELMNIYESSWIDDWYNDEQTKKKMRAQGRERLKQFYEHLVSSGHIPDIKALERPFSVKIDKYTIVGRMDRVDELPDNSVRIVDYKTGNMFNKVNKGGTLKEKEDKYQLLIYQLASEQVWREKVSNLIYHYIDAENVKSGENQIAFIGNESDKAEVKNWVVEQIRGIESGEFSIRDDAPYPSSEVEYFRDLGESGEL